MSLLCIECVKVAQHTLLVSGEYLALCDECIEGIEQELTARNVPFTRSLT